MLSDSEETSRSSSDLKNETEENAPESESENSRGDSPALTRADSVRLLRIETAIQTSDRMQHETASVAEEFERILAELKNNKVAFFEELERRIGGGIVVPLNQIVEQQFSQFDRDLKRLRHALEDQQSLFAEIESSQQQLSKIIRALENVLKITSSRSVYKWLDKLISMGYIMKIEKGHYAKCPNELEAFIC